jgi:multiple sugar transport system substrate-binding protein
MICQKKKLIFRALSLAALVLILIAGLPGCSAFAGLNQEPVTLKFAYFDNTADYAPLAEAFHEKYPNITVELDPVTFGGGNPMRDLEIKAGDVDVIRISSTEIGDEMASSFLPLDTYIATDKDFPQEDLFAGSLDGLKLDGKQYGLPASLNPYVVFYDPLKFQAKGVTPPFAGWTLEDFMTSAMAIQNTDEAAFGTPEYAYGFCSSPQFYDQVMIAYIFGGGIFDSITTPTVPTLNSQANIESLTWYASLRNEFGLMPASNDAREVGQLIVRSNCGFWMDWLDRSSFGRYMSDRELAALPLPNYGNPFTIATLESYSVLADSLHPDEAWKWVRFLLDQPTASGNLIPPRRSHIMDENYASHAAPDVLGVARSMPEQTIILGMELYRDPRLEQALGIYIQAAVQVLDGELTSQVALDAAQQQAEKSFGN